MLTFLLHSCRPTTTSRCCSTRGIALLRPSASSTRLVHRVSPRYRLPLTSPHPPTQGIADIYSSDSAEDSERERTPKGRLGKLAQKRFESMLRSLTSTRERIGRSMAFALEHADAASLVYRLFYTAFERRPLTSFALLRSSTSSSPRSPSMALPSLARSLVYTSSPTSCTTRRRRCPTLGSTAPSSKTACPKCLIISETCTSRSLVG